MSRREETLVKWDKGKKWEEIKDVKSVLADPSSDIEPQPGVRYFLAQNGGSKQSLWSEIVAVILTFFFTGIIPFLMILGVVAWYSVRARIIFILSFLTLLIPVKVYDLKVLRWRIWDTLFDYFSYSLIFDGKFDRKQKYMFAEYPHGVYVFHSISNSDLPLVALFLDLPFLTSVRRLPVIYPFPSSSFFPSFHSLTTGSALMIPIYSAILKWMGSVEASNKNLRKYLQRGSCAVVVDGIAGMYVNEPDKEMIKFSGRKGFIRAAVETGTPILPVYQFGNSQMLKLVPKALEPYARKLKCALGMIVGRFGLPIPHKKMVMSVIGEAVPVPKVDKNDPSFDKVVDEVQQKVCDEIQRVYYKYRCVYGWGDRPLEIY